VLARAPRRPVGPGDDLEVETDADSVAGTHAWLAAQVSGSYVDRLVGSRPPVRTVVLRGEPGAQLLAYAQRHPVDLLVVGRNGRHAAGPTELGTATRLLARVAPVPVLVVPPAVAPRPDRPDRAARGLGRAPDGRRVRRREVIPTTPAA
jgi:nucleotide-binding universal stress UspA family protein